MKSLTQFINESKEKPMYEEWEIHSYVDYMLKEWFNNNQNYASILSATDIYNKKELVKLPSTLCSTILKLFVFLHTKRIYVLPSLYSNPHA